MVCLLDYFLRLWFFRLSSGFSVLVLVLRFDCVMVVMMMVGFGWIFRVLKMAVVACCRRSFFGFGCNTQQSNVSSMWPIHIIQCFFSRNCVAASSFDSHSVWLVSGVCVCAWFTFDFTFVLAIYSELVISNWNGWGWRGGRLKIRTDVGSSANPHSMTFREFLSLANLQPFTNISAVFDESYKISRNPYTFPDVRFRLRNHLKKSSLGPEDWNNNQWEW